MKKLYFLIFACFALLNAQSQDCDCDFLITSEMAHFDGASVLPGQTVCVQSGMRGSLKIKNINGTADNKIRLINCGGVVVFNDPLSSSAIMFDGCTNFQLTGTGSDSEFGFFVQEIGDVGVLLRNLSNHFEIDHFRIEQAPGHAILLRDDPNCELTANEGFYTLEEANFHHLLINYCKAGISIGNPQVGMGTVHPLCGVLYPYRVENLSISNSEIANITSGEAISLYGCNGEITMNDIREVEGTGIFIKNECHLTIERNSIKTTAEFGVHVQGGGEHNFYSNLLIDNGNLGKGAIWIECFGAVGDEYENLFQIEHNTIVNSGSYNVGILNADEVSSTSRVRNNIFCEPLFIAPDGYAFSPHFYAESSPYVVVDHNLISDSKYDVGFVNPDAENFGLLHFSEAINQGVVSEIDEDYTFQLRNLAGAPDLGAYEYVPESLSFFGAIDLVGLYVDDFKNILGDELAETQLLEYAQANGFNYLLLYNLSYIHTHNYDLTDPEEAIVLANFIERAKKEYGIAQMGAVGEKDASFDKIEAFNDLFGGSWFQKFDVLNLEFEFWTDPGSDVFAYYCENYMSPGGYPCTNEGAFAFYSDELELIDERAHDMGIISEIYLGYPTDLQSVNLAERTDRILLHHYRTTDTYGDGSSIYNYHTNRIHAIAQSDRKPAVMPIFSSRAYHMGPWLITHSLHQPMDTWLSGMDGYNMDATEGVTELPIAGFQWYRYTSFLDLMEGFYAPEEMPIDVDSDEPSILAKYNSQTKILAVTNQDQTLSSMGSCEIYTVSGAVIYSRAWSSSNQKYNLSSVPGGIYFLYLKNDQGLTYCQKICLF